MEVEAILGLNDLEAIRKRLNGRRLVVLALGQTGRTSLAAVRATQLLIPLVGHLTNMDPDRGNLMLQVT